jgi:ABC-type glycerol-3-phosphate transport system substrate-binding protein
MILALLVISALLVSCSGAGATTAPTAVVQAEPTEAMAEPEPTEAMAEPTATMAAAEPTEAMAEPTEAEGEETGGEVVMPTAVPRDPADISDIPEPTEPVEISFASWVGGGAAWQTLAEQFHALHPNITIKFEDIPFEEIEDILLTRVAGNNPPDAAYLGTGTIGNFATRNALLPLNDYIALSHVIDPEDYVDAFMRAVSVDDQIYGLPIAAEVTGLFYRTDRFAEAGIEKPPATWEEFEAAAEKLTDPDNKKYGFINFATEAAYYFYPWLWQAGGDTLNPENPNDVIWDSPEGQRAADFYINLTKYSPPDYLASNSWDGRVAFANGDVAMYVAGGWFAGTLMSEFPDANGLWATAPLPSDERCATTIAADGLTILKGAKNPEAAYLWIEFVSLPENMALINLGTPQSPFTMLPPRESVLNDPATFEQNPLMAGWVDMMECAYVSPVENPRYGEVEVFLNDYLAQAMYGEIDGPTAVKESAIEAEAVLNQ